MPTKIEWTDEVWNVVTGCTKVSAGCANCYAERDFHRPYPDRDFIDVRVHIDRLDQPLRWRKPRRVFVCSMGDLFHDDVPDEFIDHVFAVMALSPQHTFQILSKRPERMRDYMVRFYSQCTPPGSLCITYAMAAVQEFLSEELSLTLDMNYNERLAQIHDRGWHTRIHPNDRLPNIWLGTSVEDQEAADERIPVLLQTPASVRFVSCEPLLGPINLPWLRYGFLDKDEWDVLDWVIVGGESGNNARPMHPDWARSIRDQCKEAGIPFFFKQWGEYAPCDHFPGLKKPGPVISLDGQDDGMMTRVGKKAAGRELDGRTWEEYPE